MSDNLTPISLSRCLLRQSLRVLLGLVMLVLLWGCGTVPGLQEESAADYIRVPFVRALLEETSGDAHLSSDNSYAIECLVGKTQEVFYSSQPVTVRNVREALTVFNYRNDIIREGLQEVNIIPRGSGSRVRLGDKRYRGILRVLPRGEVVRIINIVYMEDYLRGVVPPEIGQRIKEEIEAVKAQAVAARTYAMAHLKQYEGEPYDIKSSIMDQVYQGCGVEDKLVNKAVDETNGRVIMYHDALINAYYHSTCGGRTDNIEDVWDRKEEPYLKSVADDSSEAWSKYFSWKEVFTEQQLRGRIEQYLASDRGRDIRLDPITGITVGQRTAGGRVRTLEIHTSGDTYRFNKDRVRWVIGRTSNPDLILPSSSFDVDIERDPQGRIVSVTFNGHGYGHGVGMCQIGAISHARAGWTCEQILTHYYTDVEIRTLY
jgi:stage II sporulation protein D